MGNRRGQDFQHARVILSEETRKGVAQDERARRLLMHDDREADQRTHDAGEIDTVEARIAINVSDVQTVTVFLHELLDDLGEFPAAEKSRVRVTEKELLLLPDPLQKQGIACAFFIGMKHQTAKLGPKILEGAVDDLQANLLEIILVLDGFDDSAKPREG
jgi:hypothetical protein